MDEIAEELQPQFPSLDWPLEMQKFRAYWGAEGRKLKNPRLALLNWIDNTFEFQARHAPPPGKPKHNSPEALQALKDEINRETERLRRWAEWRTFRNLPVPQHVIDRIAPPPKESPDADE